MLLSGPAGASVIVVDIAGWIEKEALNLVVVELTGAVRLDCVVTALSTFSKLG